MGLIVDTSILVAAERARRSAEWLIRELLTQYGESLISISAVTAIEITHGVYRAKTVEDRARREAFVQDVLAGFHTEPLTLDIARLAGKLGGEEAAKGNTLPSEDLIIAATALYLRYDVATYNVRHFERVPGLSLLTPRLETRETD